MKGITGLIFWIVFLACFSKVKLVIQLDCPLIWKPMVTGDYIQSNSIITDQKDRRVIVRIQHTNGEYYGGRLIDNLATSFDNNEVINSTSFEILTNPNECVTTWVEQLPKAQEVSFHPGRLVGRIFNSNVFFPGQVTSGIISFINENGKGDSKSGGIEYLTSYSKGLRLELSQFNTGEDSFPPNQDILGMDVIHNDGDATVVQTISHRKRVLESIFITKTDFSSQTFSAEFNVNLNPTYKMKESNESKPIELEGSGGLGFTFGMEFSWGFETEETYFHERERDVRVTREIILPPFTSIQVCSMISTQEDFKLDYVSRGRYFSPGLTADSVALILSLDGKVGVKEGDSIVVEEKGSLQGTLYVTSKFIVVPFDVATGVGGCNKLAEAVYQLQKDKARGYLNKEQLIQRSGDIDKLINGFIQPKK